MRRERNPDSTRVSALQIKKTMLEDFLSHSFLQRIKFTNLQYHCTVHPCQQFVFLRNSKIIMICTLNMNPEKGDLGELWVDQSKATKSADPIFTPNINGELTLLHPAIDSPSVPGWRLSIKRHPPTYKL